MSLLLQDKPAFRNKRITLSISNTKLSCNSHNINTPTVDFGKDFELIIRRCLLEKQMTGELKDISDSNCICNADCIDLEKSLCESESSVHDVTNLDGENIKQGDIENGTTDHEFPGKAVIRSRENSMKRRDYKLVEEDYFTKYNKRKKKRKNKEQGKKRKWKVLSTGEIGFKLSLFPRIVVTTDIAENDLDKELVSFQETCSQGEDKKSESGNHARSCTENMIHITKGTVTVSSYNVCMYSELDLIIENYRVDSFLRQKWKMPNTRLRSKKKWKMPKAHKQVKSKYCTTVQNGGHGKKLFIKHRVIVLMNMQIDVYRNPHRISIKKIDRDNGFKPGNKPKNAVNIQPIIHKNFPPAARNQTLGHALDAFNFDGALSAELVNILQNVQYRELSPEDYDLLLRLDERVKPKTVDNNVLSTLKTDTVNENTDAVCLVCLDPYEIGQKRKFLPCGHAFHEQCINMWLTNSSNSCPIDNTEIS